MDDLLGEIVAALAKFPPERVFEAAARSRLSIGTAYNEADLAGGAALLTDIHATASELMEALARGDREARSAALPLLAEVDASAAAPFAVRLLDVDVSQEPAQSFASGVMRAVWAMLPQVLPTLPDEVIAGPWLRGRLANEVVPSSAIANVSIDALLDAVALGRLSFVSGVERLRGHPQLERGEQIVAVLERLLSPATARHDAYLVRFLLDRLAELRFEPAVPLLAATFRRRERSLDTATARALLAIGSEAAVDALIERFAIVAPEALPWDPHHVVAELQAPIRAVFERDPARAFDRLAAWLSPDAVSSESGARIARDVIDAAVSRPALLDADPRWVDLGLRLRADARLGPTAKRLLDRAGKKAVKEATARQAAAGGAKAAERKKKPAKAAGRRWIERYRAGEHDAVWSEMNALGEAIRDGAVRPEAEAVTRETMTRVRTNFERIVARLGGAGYAFAREGAAMFTPTATISRSIDALAALIGRPLPLSLVAFYEVVGSIDLTEGEAQYADGERIFALVGRGDPLVIVSAEEALAIAREFSGAGALDDARPSLYLGPDPDRKADPDGRVADEQPYELLIRGDGADGIVCQGAAPERSFIDFLRAAIRWGGFLDLLGEDHDPEKDRGGLSSDLLPF